MPHCLHTYVYVRQCASVCASVCTNQLIYSPRQSYEKTDNYIRSLLTIFACRKVSSGAQTPSFSFLPFPPCIPIPFPLASHSCCPMHAVSAVSCSTDGAPTEQQLQHPTFSRAYPTWKSVWPSLN